MRRILKVLAILVATVFGLLLIAFVVLQFVSGEQYKKWIGSAVESATGRELAIDGDLEVGIGSHLTLKAEKVRFANAEWGSRPEMFTAKALEADVPLLPLLKGVLDATLRVEEPDLLLETDAGGEGNWTMGEPAPEEKQGGGLPVKPLIREASIEKGKIAFLASGEQKLDARIGKLRLAQEAGTDGEPTVETPLGLELAGTVNEVPLTLKGQLASLLKLLTNQAARLDLAGEAGGAALAVNGSLGGPLSPAADLALTIKADAPTLAGFAPLTAGRIPDLGPLSATLDLTGAGGKYAIPKLEAKLDSPQATALVKGAVADLAALAGIDLEATADTDALSDLLQQTGLDLAGPLPQTVHATAKLSGSADDLAVEEFKARVSGKGLEASMDGTAMNIAALEGVDGTVSVKADSLALFSPYAGRPLPALGPLEARARIVPGESGFSLQELEAKVASDKLDASVSGSVADLRKLAGIGLDVQAKTGDLPWLLKEAAVELAWPVPRTAEFKGHLGGSMKHLAIRGLDALAQDEGVKVTAKGNAEDLVGLDGIDLDATFEVDSLARLDPYAGTELPPLGPLSGKTKITAEEGRIALTGIDAKLDSGDLKATVKGKMSDARHLSGIDLDVTADTGALAKLLKLAKIESPVEPPASVKATANVAGSFDHLEVTKFTAEAADPGLRITARGKAKNVVKQEGIAAEISLQADRLQNLSKYAGTELPDLGPLKATATVVSKGKGYEVSKLSAELVDKGIRAQVTGRIADALKLHGIDVKTDLGVDSLASLNTALAPLAKLDLPDTPPLKLQARLHGKGGIEDALVDASLTGTGIEAQAHGKVASLQSEKEKKIEFALKVDSVDQLGRLIGEKDLSGSQPFETKGTLVMGEGAVTVDPLALKLGEARAEGRVELEPAKTTGTGRPKIYGDLAFGKVNLKDLMPDVFGESWIPEAALDPGSREAQKLARAEAAKTPKQIAGEEAKLEKEKEKKKEKKKEKEKSGKKETAADESIFSTNPLPLKTLQSVDADLEVTAKSLEGYEFRLENFDAIVTLEDGVLSLLPLKARIGKGAFDGRFILDSRQRPPHLKAYFFMENATLVNFGGTVEMLIDVEGKGDSVAKLMANLNGEARVLIRNAVLKKSAMTQFGSGLLESMNPMAKQRETTDLICAIAHLDITDGIIDAKNKIAAQTTEVTWFGSAEVNLKTGKIDVRFHPKARKGLGISAGQLASLVYVGGTIKEPHIQLNPTDIALKYGKYTAAIATGGISFLVELIIDKAQANVNVCDRIIQTVAKEQAKAEKKAAKEEKKRLKAEGRAAPAEGEENAAAGDKRPRTVTELPAEPTGPRFKNPFYEPSIP